MFFVVQNGLFTVESFHEKLVFTRCQLTDYSTSHVLCVFIYMLNREDKHRSGCIRRCTPWGANWLIEIHCQVVASRTRKELQPVIFCSQREQTQGTYSAEIVTLSGWTSKSDFPKNVMGVPELRWEMWDGMSPEQGHVLAGGVSGWTEAGLLPLRPGVHLVVGLLDALAWVFLKPTPESDTSLLFSGVNLLVQWERLPKLGLSPKPREKTTRRKFLAGMVEAMNHTLKLL